MHTIVAVDVQGFGGRDATHQSKVREALNKALAQAFALCGLPLDLCHTDDRGDGLRVLVPPELSAKRLVEHLPDELAGLLRVHNATADKQARIRLRIVIHSGEIETDTQGYNGPALVLTARLLDSKVLKRALKYSNGILALITSAEFFHRVVEPSPAANPGIYRRVWVVEKETRTWAWIFLPDHHGSTWWLWFRLRRYLAPAKAAKPVKPPTSSTPRPRPRGRIFLRYLSWVVVLLLVALLGRNILASLPPDPRCPEPVQLNLNVSPEKAGVIRNLAADFESEPAGCKEVSVQVTVAASSNEVITAFGGRWLSTTDLPRLGPEPHVYLPDSGWEFEAAVNVVHKVRTVGVTLDNLGSIAYSPLALVRPAGGTDQPDTWADVLELAQQGQGMLRPGLMSSGTGLIATIALYSAVLGDRLDQTTLNAATDLRAVELAVPAGDESGALLCTLAWGRTSAVLVSEKAVGEHLLENGRGGRCGSSTQLEITYPRDGTFYLDHPFVAVGWPGRPPNKARDKAVRAFHEFLTGRHAQAELRRARFRDIDGNLDPFPGAPVSRPPVVDVDVVDVPELQGAHHDARRPARVQLLLDVSRAMNEPFPATGGTRLPAAVVAARSALSQVDETDQVGLWEFAEGLGGTTDHRMRVPLREGGALAARNALENQTGDGEPAPTYEAVRAAVAGLRESRPRSPTSDAVVIIADGTTAEPDSYSLTEFLRTGHRVPVFMVAFGTSACSKTWAKITRDTGGACHEVVDTDDVDEALASVATALWGRT